VFLRPSREGSKRVNVLFLRNYRALCTIIPYILLGSYVKPVVVRKVRKSCLRQVISSILTKASYLHEDRS
jgi:hypothetical protein